MSDLTQANPTSAKEVDVRFGNILLPTDFSDASLAALPHVVAIAKRFGSQVYVVHVFLPPSYPNIPAAVATSVLQQERDAAQRELQAFLNREDFGNLQPKLVFSMGSATDGLLQVIAEKEIDLVVMATHGRTGFRRLVLGSVTEAIVRRSPCPVLTVPMAP